MADKNQRSAVPQGGVPPDPSQLGAPSAFFPPSSCDPATFFTNQQIIFDITLCGDWYVTPVVQSIHANCSQGWKCHGWGVSSAGRKELLLDLRAWGWTQSQSSLLYVPFPYRIQPVTDLHAQLKLPRSRFMPLILARNPLLNAPLCTLQRQAIHVPLLKLRLG